jgi:hypothetical protein
VLEKKKRLFQNPENTASLEVSKAARPESKRKKEVMSGAAKFVFPSSNVSAH